MRFLLPLYGGPAAEAALSAAERRATREQPGSVYLVDCADAAAALAPARRMPRSPALVVEIREITEV